MERNGRWNLVDLIDFEQAMGSSSAGPGEEEKRALLADGPDRRVVWRRWLESRREAGSRGPGRKFFGALRGVTFGLAVVMALVGGSTVLGLWERDRGGINVGLFLALVLGTQWLVLLGALLAWIFHRRAGEAFSQIQGWVGALARRFSGEREAEWWYRLMEEGAARKALLWRLARAVQTAGVAFNLGALAALAGLILFRNIGFFWETTTESTMRAVLWQVTHILSAPWQVLDPIAVPGSMTLDATRWEPGEVGKLAPGPPEWWRFLLWSLVVWGMGPRWILRAVCRWQEGRALKAVAFQSKHHRAAWREWFATDQREEIRNRPTDGALVIDVGGAGFSKERLRPLLLQKLRVNPVAWERTGVLDADSEAAAREALARAEAAIVLLVEGWALSPRQIEALLTRVGVVKEGRRVILFVGNAAPEGAIRAPEADERRTWEGFVDGLKGSEVELVFAEGGAA
ncbi:DUF2868 domain-containing protein [Luteolibacter sp. LG18]|uniref:DUF2868 domain-containing protein n=1 Tax=Luteolibacter sp. LG18 TaxID=2819286 RepID=UPI002B31AA92|nr:hypothetical protein llg_03850 [Luteolibacter sp. LG18]